MESQPAELVPVPRMEIRVRQSRGVTYLGFRDEVVALEDVSAFIWRHVDGSRTVADIGTAVAAAYDIDSATVTPDVLELMESLVERGFVQLAPPGAVDKTWR